MPPCLSVLNHGWLLPLLQGVLVLAACRRSLPLRLRWRWRWWRWRWCRHLLRWDSAISEGQQLQLETRPVFVVLEGDEVLLPTGLVALPLDHEDSTLGLPTVGHARYLLRAGGRGIGLAPQVGLHHERKTLGVVVGLDDVYDLLIGLWQGKTGSDARSIWLPEPFRANCENALIVQWVRIGYPDYLRSHWNVWSDRS